MLFFQSSLRDGKSWGIPLPAMNCRAILKSPYGTKNALRNENLKSQLSAVSGIFEHSKPLTTDRQQKEL
jgi:hypothetical protein